MWTNSLPALWTVLELNIACMCACLPGLTPVITKLFPKNVFSRDYPSHTEGAEKRHTRSSRTQSMGFRRMPRDSWQQNTVGSEQSGAGSASRMQRTVDIYGDTEDAIVEMQEESHGSISSDGHRLLLKSGTRVPRPGEIRVTERVEQRFDWSDSLERAVTP